MKVMYIKEPYVVEVKKVTFLNYEKDQISLWEGNIFEVNLGIQGVANIFYDADADHLYQVMIDKKEETNHLCKSTLIMLHWEKHKYLTDLLIHLTDCREEETLESFHEFPKEEPTIEQVQEEKIAKEVETVEGTAVPEEPTV